MDSISELFSPSSPEMIGMHSAYLHPSLQPIKALREAMIRAVRRPDAWVYPPSAGITELRQWFAAAIGGERGDLSAGDIVSSRPGLRTSAICG